MNDQVAWRVCVLFKSLTRAMQEITFGPKQWHEVDVLWLRRWLAVDGD